MIAGIDVSTRSVDIVLLEDEGYEAEWRQLLLPKNMSVWELAQRIGFTLRGLPHDVWLVGVEDPFSMSKGIAKKLGIITGAVLASLFTEAHLLALPPKEWKRIACGSSEAKKQEVAAWVASAWPNSPSVVTQDALDAYAIAYAARELNAQAVAAMR